MESARWKQGRKKQDKEYEIGYLEHYITYRKGKGGSRRNERYKTKTLRISETKKRRVTGEIALDKNYVLRYLGVQKGREQRRVWDLLFQKN